MAATRGQEVEVKFRVNDLKALARRLRAAGFRLQTRRTFESNLLFDSHDRGLSTRGEVLRVRRYGDDWTLTHKSRGQDGRHKVREETESAVADGTAVVRMLERLGFSPAFRYEKFRTEWSDGKGHVVIDETPIGDFAEIEGSAGWIDRTAKKLGVAAADYLTASYATLFSEWKARTGSAATAMTWKAITGKNRLR